MYIIEKWNEWIWVSTLVKSEKKRKAQMAEVCEKRKTKRILKIGSIKPLEIRKRNFSLVSNSKNSEKGS